MNEKDNKFLCSLTKGKELTLLYRASRDGWMGIDFHSRCDNQGPTFTLLKTGKGRVCGGFTSVDWDSSNTNKKDIESFMFSVDHQRMFKVSGSRNSINCYNTFGPSFESCLKLASPPFNRKDGCRSDQNNDMYYGNIKDSEGNSVLTGGDKVFTAVEIEVFKL